MLRPLREFFLAELLPFSVVVIYGLASEGDDIQRKICAWRVVIWKDVYETTSSELSNSGLFREKVLPATYSVVYSHYFAA